MSDKLKEYLNMLHDRNVFIPTKTILLYGGIDDDILEEFTCNLHALDSVTGEITIKLISEGGCLTAARAIYDLIRGCKNFVRIIVYGEAASAATIVLQAADLRVMAENSKLMIHVGSEGIARDHPRNVDAIYNEHRVDEKWIEDRYLKRIKEKKPRYTRQQLKDMLVWDRTIKPKGALDLGLIDKIGEIS